MKTKHIIPTLLLISVLMGCTGMDTKSKKSEVSRFETIIIDSCQYIYRSDGYSYGGVLCHKGNCNNPIHIK